MSKKYFVTIGYGKHIHHTQIPESSYNKIVNSDEIPNRIFTDKGVLFIRQEELVFLEAYYTLSV